MPNGYHLIINDAQIGPFTADDIQEQYRRLKVSGDTLCWKEGFECWTPLSNALPGIHPGFFLPRATDDEPEPHQTAESHSISTLPRKIATRRIKPPAPKFFAIGAAVVVVLIVLVCFPGRQRARTPIQEAHYRDGFSIGNSDGEMWALHKNGLKPSSSELERCVAGFTTWLYSEKHNRQYFPDDPDWAAGYRYGFKLGHKSYVNENIRPAF